MRAKNRADLGIRYCATGLRLAASNVMAPLAVAVAVRLLPYRHADGGSRLFSLNRRRGRVIKMSVPRLPSRLLYLVLVCWFLGVAIFLTDRKVTISHR